MGSNRRRLTRLEYREGWRGYGERLETQEGVRCCSVCLEFCFVRILFSKDLSRSHGKAFKDCKQGYDLLKSVFLKVLFASA